MQDHLSRCFLHIAAVLQAKAKAKAKAKARLFDPDNNGNVEHLLYELSLSNSAVIENFNRTKTSLLTRLKSSRTNQKTIYWLNLYFLAQDIHEQASANYLHYEKIQQKFSRTDLIFRFQKNIRLQAQACETLAQCILRHEPYTPNAAAQQALDHLHNSLQD